MTVMLLATSVVPPVVAALLPVVLIPITATTDQDQLVSEYMNVSTGKCNSSLVTAQDALVGVRRFTFHGMMFLTTRNVL